MPRTKEQFAEMRNATRDKIQTAAMQLFVQKGFGSTTVQEIADQADISIGLLYRHYKTKEQLFSDLVDFSLKGLKAVQDLFKTEGSPRQLLEQFVSEVHNDLKQGDDLANLLILMKQAFFSRGADVQQDELGSMHGEMLRSTAQLIQRGQQLGEFRQGDPLEMAVYFFAAIQGLAEMKVMLKDNFVLPSPSLFTANMCRNWE